MPRSGYFFDAVIRQPELDEDNLILEDNLEEFGLMGEEETAYWRAQAEGLRGSKHAVVTHLNGTCLGDIALVPAPFLTHPKGVRDVAQWYMTLAEEPEFVGRIFDHQVEVAIGNMRRLHGIAGDVIDIVVVCGTDFGTQESTFCYNQTFNELWKGRYRKINGWIHENTKWKTFKHSCGAIEGLIPDIIDSGFDILNPVQCSARGMDPQTLKARHGDRITFWGGAINTQQTLPFGTPEQVRQEVLERCRIFGEGGGFVFNAIHNIQALTPLANLIAMMDALNEFNRAGA
jgi:uroporphyrinogen-III decarboxylase